MMWLMDTCVGSAVGIAGKGVVNEYSPQSGGEVLFFSLESTRTVKAYSWVPSHVQMAV